jgi:hypothetical protein
MDQLIKPLRRYKPPFPWFGGKSRVAADVWARFGKVANYVEPFMGSLAMLILRPAPIVGSETVNDLDGFLANFWRAVQHDPEGLAAHADWPVNENDLHARHYWLKGERGPLTFKLEADPDFFDVKIAGWWCWGLCCWIGSEWCGIGHKGPWSVVNGELVNTGVDLGNSGQGVNRQLVHLGDAGMGVHRQRVDLGDAGMGVHRQRVDLINYFDRLSTRLRGVRVCCGNWDRVCSRAPTTHHGLTAVFLDPPYSDTADRDPELYAQESSTVAHDVREWAIANGNNRLLRIALCGYDGEYAMPSDWIVFEWKSSGGYSTRGSKASINCHRERIWFSPHCVRVNDYPLFSMIEKMETS